MPHEPELMVRPPLLELPEELEEPVPLLLAVDGVVELVDGVVELVDGLLLEVVGLEGVLRVRPVTLPPLLLLEELVDAELTAHAEGVVVCMGCSGCKG